MTVQYINSSQKILGDSSERGGELGPAEFGAEFFETDTGRTYRKVSASNSLYAKWAANNLSLDDETIDLLEKLLAVNTTPWLRYTNWGVDIANVAKVGAGQLFSVAAYNRNASVRYLQFHDKPIGVAASGNIPIFSYPIPGGSTNNPGILLLDQQIFGPAGETFLRNIGWAFSTVEGSYTAGTNTDHGITIRYL